MSRFFSVFSPRLLAIPLVVSLALSTPLHAVDAPARRLQIAPLRTELTLKPSTAYSGIIKLKNTGTKPLTAELSAEAFDVVGETYDYTFLPQAAASGWVHFSSQSISIEPDQTVPVQFALNIPADAEPGGVYISLFGSSLPDDTEGIQSTERVGSLLYVTVDGLINKTGSLIDFSTPLFTAGDIAWSGRIHNTGTVHFSTDYQTSLHTLWGTPLSETTNTSLILPNTIRRIDGSLPHPDWLGIYLLRYTIPLGDGTIATGSRIVVYAPIGQTVATLTLITGAGLFIHTTLQRRRHNRRTPTES